MNKNLLKKSKLYSHLTLIKDFREMWPQGKLSTTTGLLTYELMIKNKFCIEKRWESKLFDGVALR